VEGHKKSGEFFKTDFSQRRSIDGGLCSVEPMGGQSASRRRRVVKLSELSGTGVGCEKGGKKRNEGGKGGRDRLRPSAYYR